MKKWDIQEKNSTADTDLTQIISILLSQRGFATTKERELFIAPPDPWKFTPADVGINPDEFAIAIERIQMAIEMKESIVVYADYDADGITAGAILWETLYELGAQVMPYIPHRVDEGYGLSTKGIDMVVEKYHPTVIITVDHGITAVDQVSYAQSLGIDVIITDHHVAPDIIPETTIVHTTELAGSGVSWFVAKSFMKKPRHDLLSLAAIGTIADMVPLIGPNRSIAKYGLAALRQNTIVGLTALMQDAGIDKATLSPYSISHVLAPRLNAMGRLEHAMDALRLLCTRQEAKAKLLAEKLTVTNKERQKMTEDMTAHAKTAVDEMIKNEGKKNLLFLADESYNQGVIGLVAGRLVETYYRPAIVIAKGETISKASARSIAGFNIVESIRSCSDLLIDIGGHPMAAGFTIETIKLPALKEQLELLANETIQEEQLTRSLRIDVLIPLTTVTESLWKALRDFEPFGLGNTEPVFATKHVEVVDVKLLGAEKKHLKLQIAQKGSEVLEAIGFGMGDQYAKVSEGKIIDIAYSIDMNEWNGRRTLQLKIKDIQYG